MSIRAVDRFSHPRNGPSAKAIKSFYSASTARFLAHKNSLYSQIIFWLKDYFCEY